MRHINEESAKGKQRTFSTTEEASVFQKLIDINPKVAVIMTLDMLMAGTDTVRNFNNQPANVSLNLFYRQAK